MGCRKSIDAQEHRIGNEDNNEKEEDKEDIEEEDIVR